MPAVANASYMVPAEYAKTGSYPWSNMFAYMLATLIDSARWEVPAWSDGTTYHNDGSVPGQNELPAGSWCRVRAVHADNPTTGDKQEWCFIFISTSATTGTTVKHSRAAGFSGGTAGTPPTAADQIYLIGTTDAAGGKFTYSSVNYTGLVGYADKASNAFLFAGLNSSAQTYEMAWWNDPINGTEDGDDFKYVMSFSSLNDIFGLGTFTNVTAANRPAWSYYYDAAMTLTSDRPFPTKFFGYNQAFPNGMISSQLPSAPAWDIAPFLWTDFTVPGNPRGWSTTMWWVGQTTASFDVRSIIDWLTAPSDVGGLLVLSQTVAIPWNNQDIVLTHCGTWTKYNGQGSQIWQQASQLEYVMRGYDTTLGQDVYWSATYVDSTGAIYTGPGPLTNIVVFERIPSLS